MPVTDGIFTRIWRFIDQFSAATAVKRSDLDTAFDDVAAGINAALAIEQVGTVSGATPELDIDVAQYFLQSDVSFDLTVTFSNIPDIAKWTYAIEIAPKDAGSIEYLRPTSLLKLGVAQSRGVFVAPDGLTCLVLDSGDVVRSVGLKRPFDLQTAVSLGIDGGVSGTSQNINMTGMTAKPDGAKLFMTGTAAPASVFSYAMLTAWDASTGLYDGGSVDVSAQTTSPQDIAFKADGTKLYVLSAGTIYQYSLSTPWDLSTAAYDSVTGSIGSATSFAFSSDGGAVIAAAGNGIYQYDLSTAWDLSTLSVATLPSGGTNINFSNENYGIGNIAGSDQHLISHVVGTDFCAAQTFSIADYPVVTLPAAVQNVSDVQVRFLADGLHSLEFVTTDGGTSIYLAGLSEVAL